MTATKGNLQKQSSI